MIRSSKRTDRVKYVDPNTGLTEYRYVEKVTYRYEDEEKVPIVLEFLKGEVSAEKLVEKYHICSVQTLYAWVGRYISPENLLTLHRGRDKQGEFESKQKLSNETVHLS